VLHILILEDSALDADLIGARLSEGGVGCELTRVHSRDTFGTALEEGGVDLILADYAPPGFDGLSALRLARELRPGVPFIFVSSTLGEEVAIEALKSGATDYVLKHRLERLLPAVRRAMRIVALDVIEPKRSEAALRQSLNVLMALREAGQVLSSTLESEEIVTRLLEIMRSVANLTAAVISRFNQEGNLRVWRSAGLEDLWPRIRFTPEAKTARRAVLEIEEQQLFALRRPGSEDESCVVLCLPICTRDRIVGVLEAFGQESLARNDMIEIVSSLTGQAATALENARLYEELGDRERALQNLVEKLLGAQEEERRRVAYEVHDGLAQVAVAAHQNLQAFARRHTPETEQGRRELDRILGQVRATVSDARRVIANLRPTALDDLGLAAAISLEVERLSEEGYQIDYKERLGDERLPAEMEIALFRVAQEALTNMRKHAGTQWVRIELRRQNGEVYLEVRDFGRGFDPAALRTLGGGPGERVGLAGMRERVTMLGGELEIKSRPDAGTSVAASIPLPRTA